MVNLCVNGLKEILEDRGMPIDIYVTRRILNINPSLTFTESYAFAMDYGSGDTAEQHVAVLRSKKTSPERWIDSPLSDIVKKILLGNNKRQERQVKKRLYEGQMSVLEYHPQLNHAREIREQFFARARALDRITLGLYQVTIARIAGSPRTVYEKELGKAPDIREFRVLMSEQA